MFKNYAEDLILVLFSAFAVLTLSLLSPVELSAQETPQIGLYFDGSLINQTPLEAYNTFQGDLYIIEADRYISAVEYKIDIQNYDEIFVIDVEYPLEHVFHFGDPISGHSIAFSPSLSPSADTVLVCRITFMPVKGCDAMTALDIPISLVPHPDSGLLGATEWPENEIFELTGLSSILCPSHWPPMLNDVTVCGPRCVKAAFNQYVYNWGMGYDDHFDLYTTAEPRDTIQVVEAIKTDCYGGGGAKFFVYLESPMEAGVEYTLAADACAECNGCAHSEFEFIFDGGFAELPDLALTYLIDNDNGLDEFVEQDCITTTFDYTLRNLGEAACGPFNTRIMVYPQSDGTSPVTLWEDSCGGLGVDGTFSRTVSVMVPNMPSYRNILEIEVDYMEDITESNTENNRAETLFWNLMPEIISINDVPDDTGGEVEMLFRASFSDVHYPGGDYTIHRLEKSNGLWERVMGFPGTGDSTYTRILPTEVDSTGGVEDYWTVFKVDYYGLGTCCPDSGYSIDNFGPIATFLQSSELEVSGSSVIIKWTVSGGSEATGFDIYRSEGGAPYTRIVRIPVSDNGTFFDYEDHSVEPGGKYTYRVEYTDEEGSHLLFKKSEVEIPQLEFSLGQNVPNPFNPVTDITFYIPAASTAVLDIFDVSGRRVRRLAEGSRRQGWYTESWNGLDDDGNPVASGIYFYRLTSGKFKATKRMVLLR